MIHPSAKAPPVTEAPLARAQPAKTAPPAQLSSSYEPYSSARSLALFETYADSDNADVIGPEGFTQLCTDAQISLEGALPLILAWQLGAKEMGKFTKDEWTKGMELLR